MFEDTPGIHHVTGVVGDVQSNVEFYAGVLGLRLVKRTVNREDSSGTTSTTGTATPRSVRCSPPSRTPVTRLGDRENHRSRRSGSSSLPVRSATGPTASRPAASMSPVRSGASTGASSGSKTRTAHVSNW